MKKILVVDDTEGIRSFLKEFLEVLGLEVFVCDNGREAIPYINTVDAIITDFEMPRMSGVELTEFAKKRRPDLPVLIMTGNPYEIPVDHLANKVVTKPFKNKAITEWLDEVLKN